MSKTLRRVATLLPCVPGVSLLLAGGVVWLIDREDFRRAGPILLAGGMVVLAGWVIGAFVSWRLKHPRPDEEDEEQNLPR